MRVKRRTFPFIAFALVVWVCGPIHGQILQSVFYQSAEWSPDGKSLVFAAIILDSGKYEGGRWELYSVNADGSHLKRLTKNNQRDLWPAWSPDGKKIAYESDVAGDLELFVMDVRSGKSLQLTRRVGRDMGPAWSPDGRTVAFVGEVDGNYELCLIASDGSGFERVSRTPHKEYNPVWSPDGKYITYYYEKGDHKDQLFAISMSEKGKPIPITSDTLNNVFPGWSREGLVYSTYDGQVGKLVLKKINNGCLSNGSCADAVVEELRVDGFFARLSPDGRKIVYLGGDWPNGQLMISERNGTSAHELVTSAALLELR